ncbi:hypothetical protein M2451_002862 [Dysgonomonas sp. PFB1-18]|uniref:alpha-1,2-fucosyltransferase n=1 Tax=unclassified Dysgonomonas TaxID=2630389 RepID=UPI002477187A|nr:MULTISPECIES: alpha-1,2-fucosyltransferase [unclassified Dysgonomonas]MDH6309972.1 hypothetical protein [Dysgonomonas sp. PF1-14]MDH6339881.1 hypothetical protein [Dysgonomonas sp. PF1-16]MDH6381529.1 hypothetical protein [Dysgonomonas sp. PFB1-18]MDH6398834.1 hypothetical protein [Dysgonomonas sp. PF1-23]
MIINYDSPGQLCNRIWSLVPSIAYGLEHEEKMQAVNFSEYSDGFENLNVNKLISFPPKKLSRKFFHFLKAKGYIQNGRPNIFSRLFNLNLIEGWSNRLGNADMVQRQSDGIREIFTFSKGVTGAVDQVFSSVQEDTVVGVHIRRGDYREWLDGIYYYVDEDYYYMMNTLNELLTAEGHKVKFLLCSNESIDLDNFKGLNYFVIPDSSGIKDLYALSKCSYIIGPPSTYSEWASFMGKVPVKYITSINEKIMLSDFSRIVSFNKFENGNELVID